MLLRFTIFVKIVLKAILAQSVFYGNKNYTFVIMQKKNPSVLVASGENLINLFS